MKLSITFLSYLLLFLLYSAQAQVDSTHAAKAKSLIQYLISGQPIPKAIWSSDSEFIPPAHLLTYFFKTKRPSEKKADSVQISVLITDTLLELDLDEDYWRDGVSIGGYHYNIFNGELTFAYENGVTGAPINSKINRGDGIVLIPVNQKQLFKYTKGFSDERDEIRAMKIFIPKLFVTIDELYEILIK